MDFCSFIYTTSDPACKENTKCSPFVWVDLFKAGYEIEYLFILSNIWNQLFSMEITGWAQGYIKPIK
jgi:hypothetical protein